MQFNFGRARSFFARTTVRYKPLQKLTEILERRRFCSEGWREDHSVDASDDPSRPAS